MFFIVLSILAAVMIVVAGIVFKQKAIATPIAIALPLVVCVFEAFTVVSAGHVGVQITLGEVNPNTLTEGVHFVNPISSVKEVDVRLQRAELKNASAGTKDLQQVHTDIVVGYRLSGQKVPHIYKEFGLDVDSKVLGPALNEAFKAVTAKYNSEELITKRDEVSQTITQHISNKVAPFDISINNVSLVNFGFSKNYQDAIEAKVTATQAKLKAEQDLERIKVEAASRIAQAEGEAKAIAIQASAIQSQGGQSYVQLQWIEKWNGQLPTTMLGGDTKTLMQIGK